VVARSTGTGSARPTLAFEAANARGRTDSACAIDF